MPHGGWCQDRVLTGVAIAYGQDARQAATDDGWPGHLHPCRGGREADKTFRVSGLANLALSFSLHFK